MARTRARGIRLLFLRDEGGFALIETIVSAVLLVVVALATYPVIDQSAGQSASNRSRGIAVSLAEQDQDRLRSMAQGTRENINQTYTDAENGITFTINSKAELTSDSTGVVTCSTSSGAAQYDRITSTVTWPNMNGVDPVVLESIVTPNVSGVQRGTLIVTVQKADGTGQPGIVVSAGGQSKTTDASGCALFSSLSPGDTTVTANQTGFVGTDSLQAQSKPVSIVVGESSVVSFQYDKPAGFATGFRLQGTTTASSWYSATFKSGSAAAVTRPTSALSSPVASLTGSQTGGLFPFTAGYQAWAGSCAGNNPNNYLNTYFTQNPEGTAIAQPNTSSTQIYAYLRRVTVRVTKTTSGFRGNGRMTSAPYFEVEPAGSTMTGCTEGFSRQLTTSRIIASNYTSTNGTLPANTVDFYVDLPWGTYSICADSGSVRRRYDSYVSTPPGATPTATSSSITFNLDDTSNPNGSPQTYASGTC